MGKTKTAILEGVTGEKKSGKEAYEEKMRKRAEAEKLAGEKSKVVKVGLKGGERIKVIGGESVEVIEPVSETEEGVTEAEAKTQRKPKVRSNKYKTAKAKVEKTRNYKLDDAIKLLKEISYSKFDETIELHLVVKNHPTNINVTLPHSGGKEKRVEIASEATVEKLKKGKIDFDILLATADMMPKLVPFAKTLGPKGLMPNPKAGTLIKSKKDAEKFSGNSMQLKTEKEQPVIHTVAGKLSQKEEELKANVDTILGALNKNLVKAYIKSTMSPSVKLQI